MGDGTDLIDVVLRDHREIDRCFQELENGGLRGEQRRELLEHVIVELVRHDAAEALFLFPAVRELLGPDGDDLAERGLQAHAEAELTMAELDGVDPHTPAFDGLARQLVTQVRHHIADADCLLLPRLRDSCPADRRVELGERMLNLRETAPMRPHPLVPEGRAATRPELAPGAGLVHRMRAAIAEAVA